MWGSPGSLGHGPPLLETRRPSDEREVNKEGEGGGGEEGDLHGQELPVHVLSPESGPSHVHVGDGVGGPGELLHLHGVGPGALEDPVPRGVDVVLLHQQREQGVVCGA